MEGKVDVASIRRRCCIRVAETAAGWGAGLLLFRLLLRILEPPQHVFTVQIYASQTKDTPPPDPPRPVLTKELYVGGHRVPHPELCPRLGAGLALLVLVTSAPEHAAAREAVRRTWGSLASQRNLALAFVIGLPHPGHHHKRYRKRLAREDAMYRDIIQGNWVDSYSNLTLKVLSMLEWCETYCPRATRLFKADDDVFLNVPLLLRFLATPHRANATRTIWGEYVTGPGYVMTADCVRPLLRAALNRPYVRLEDAFITGVLADALGFKRQHEFTPMLMTATKDPCMVQRNMLVHKVTHREQYELWRKLHDATANCT